MTPVSGEGLSLVCPVKLTEPSDLNWKMVLDEVILQSSVVRITSSLGILTFTQLRPRGSPLLSYMQNQRPSLRTAICKVNCLLLEGLTKIILPVRSNRSKTGVLYIPADVVKDSSFPFSADQEVVIKIDDGRLVIERRRS